MIHQTITENYICFGITYYRRLLHRKSSMITNHRHNVSEIVFALEGEAIISCGNTVLHVSAPFIAHYPANIDHYQDNSGSEVYTRWCFPLIASDIEGADWMANRFFAVELNEEQTEQLAAYVRILYTYWGKESAFPINEPIHTSEVDLLRRRHLLLLFLNDLKPLIPHAVTAKISYISDVCVYITENLTSKITLDHLSEQFFVGRTKLTKDFRRAMSMSVVEFITTVRVNHAKTLLQENLSLKEIADQCGFTTLPYFIKVFTNHTGLSPTQYRKVPDDLHQE